ncbi:MAG: hypothetical protein IT582_02610 [Opitutaceae bacterium]|nr:hypothetical protein [Opitutaceae bacterium]
MIKRIVGWWLMCGATVAVWAAQFAPGDKVEIYSARQWAPGVIREVKADQYKVGFDGYSAVWDAWVSADKVRASAAAATPTAAQAPTTAANFKPGDRVKAKTFGMWFEGTVGEVETSRVQVRFDDNTVDWIINENVKLLENQASVGQLVVASRPEGAKAGIEGVFLRVESFFMGTSLTLSNQAWFFTKDGKFSRAPSGGFSFKGFEPKRNSDGTYWVAGGKITFAYADGSKPLTYDFQNKGDELKWGGLGASRVEGFPKGWRFDGVYEGGASIGGGAMASSSAVEFRRDGTYAREGVANVGNTTSQSVVSGGAQSRGAGTYAFDGYTLTLKPNDGAAVSYTVIAFGEKDAAGRPEYIYRDGTMMKRQK